MEYSKDKNIIGRMFDEISPSYDMMNHIMSGGLDLIWRKKAVKYLSSLDLNFSNILDLAAGSGDFGKEFMKLKPRQLYSADLSREMLIINSKKIKSARNLPIIADAENLPFKNNLFDLCGISFGIRNFENIELCLKEIQRVLNENGILIVIEMFKPHNANLFNKSFKLYFNKLVPRIGNFVSGSNYAYNYLHQSVDSFLTVGSFINITEKNGLKLVNKINNFSDIVFTVCFKKSR
jgi:demethylmenaquinone methyltransferase/2-methoxy-6-polyprenyl-1,4-benzoquinol methylase